MILVFLEFVVQDSDQVKCYFIVNAEIDLKTNTFLKMAWGTSRKKKKKSALKWSCVFVWSQYSYSLFGKSLFVQDLDS